MSDKDVSEEARARTAETLAADLKTLHSLGYAQELARAMGGFSSFAVSFNSRSRAACRRRNDLRC